jgi:O-antigen/teichoic acid export membrane protein
LQAALTDSAVHALFPERWWEAIAPLQILSIGMAMRAAGWPAIALMQAQARFNARLRFVSASFAILVLFVVVGAWMDGVRGAAIGAALQMALTDPISLYIALRPARMGWLIIARTLLPPIALALTCVGPAFAAGALVGPVPGQHWWRMIIITIVAAALFFPLFRLLLPATFNEARVRLGGLIGRSQSEVVVPQT